MIRPVTRSPINLGAIGLPIVSVTVSLEYVMWQVDCVSQRELFLRLSKLASLSVTVSSAASSGGYLPPESRKLSEKVLTPS